MLKRTGLAMLALLAVLVLANPPAAHAAVRFGVAVGPRYAYPVAPYAYGYPYGYYPYAYPYYGYPYYSYPYAYGYPGGLNFYFGGHREYRYYSRYDRGHFYGGPRGGYNFHGGYRGGGHHR